MTQLHPGGKHLPPLGIAEEENEDLTSCLRLSGPVSCHQMLRELLQERGQWAGGEATEPNPSPFEGKNCPSLYLGFQVES